MDLCSSYLCCSRVNFIRNIYLVFIRDFWFIAPQSPWEFLSYVNKVTSGKHLFGGWLTGELTLWLEDCNHQSQPQLPMTNELINYAYVMKPPYMCAKLLQLCPTLCNPRDCSPPGFSVHRIFQASILEWVAMPFSRGSSQHRDQTHVSCRLLHCRCSH